MASKMVTDRQKSAEAVGALGKAQSAELATALGDRLRVEGPLTLAEFLDVLATTVVDSSARMVEKDVAHEAELADDPKARDDRDEAAAALSARLVELREVVTGLYGATATSRVFTSPAPRDPVVLERFAGEVAERLQTASLGASRIAGASIDAAVVAQELNQQRQVLRERLADVAREVREAQVSQVAKQAAIDDYDRAFTGIATVFQGLFALVGKDELAARVRPSQRRPGQTEEAGEEAEQPG